MSISLKNHEDRITALEKKISSIGTIIQQNRSKIIGTQTAIYYSVVAVPKATTRIAIIENTTYQYDTRYIYTSINNYTGQNIIGLPSGEFKMQRFTSYNGSPGSLVTDRYDFYKCYDWNQSGDNTAILFFINDNISENT